MRMLMALLRTDIVDGPAIVVTTLLAAVGLVVIVVRRPTRAWLLTVLIAAGGGLLAAVVTWFVTVRVLNLFGTGLGLQNYLWIAAVFAGVAVAVASLWRARWWRRVVAVLCIPLFVVTGALAINADYGLDRTLGDLLAIPTAAPIRLAASTDSSAQGSQLWRTWKPPADMPETGRVGMQTIPHTISGFPSRPAGIYLPPTALVKNPPRLPLVVMMLGQPGSPMPSFASEVLDPFARAHHGLAPIVIVADQLGNPYVDPLCLDTTRYGKAETFLTKDLPAWAETHLNITKDHRFWTVAGYSNGGECGLSLIVRHPGLFGNLIDASGEEFAGSDNPGLTLSEAFHGDQAAYDRVKPETYLAHHSYAGVNAIFTAGSEDPAYWAAAQKMAKAANDAGMAVDLHEVMNGNHGRPAFASGMAEGFRVLYPVLGLAPPASR